MMDSIGNNVTLTVTTSSTDITLNNFRTFNIQLDANWFKQSEEITPTIVWEEARVLEHVMPNGVVVHYVDTRETPLVEFEGYEYE